MDITGILKVKGEASQVSEQFKKMDFVLTIDPNNQYPQHVSFQLTQSKCDLLNNYIPGAEIKVSFNLRGREWVDPQGVPKYFNTLEAWRIEGKQNGGNATSTTNVATTTSTATTNTSEQAKEAAVEGDDLPF